MTTQLAHHASSAASGALAASICMAVCQLIGFIFGWDTADSLLYGLSLSSLTFGSVYAGVFFGTLSRAKVHERETVAGRV